MKMFKTGTFSIFITIFALGGCTPALADFSGSGRRYEPIPLYLLTIGEPKSDVVSALGPPNNVIGSKRIESKTIEVWEYERWEAVLGHDRLAETYYVYFLDGQLEQWGRPGDWEREADEIYELRVR